MEEVLSMYSQQMSSPQYVEEMFSNASWNAAGLVNLIYTQEVKEIEIDSAFH